MSMLHINYKEKKIKQYGTDIEKHKYPNSEWVATDTLANHTHWIKLVINLKKCRVLVVSWIQ